MADGQTHARVDREHTLDVPTARLELDGLWGTVEWARDGAEMPDGRPRIERRRDSSEHDQER